MRLDPGPTPLTLRNVQIDLVSLVSPGWDVRGRHASPASPRRGYPSLDTLLLLPPGWAYPSLDRFLTLPQAGISEADTLLLLRKAGMSETDTLRLFPPGGNIRGRLTSPASPGWDGQRPTRFSCFPQAGMLRDRHASPTSPRRAYQKADKLLLLPRVPPLAEETSYAVSSFSSLRCCLWLCLVNVLA
jgi:hypothetical protein